MSDLRAGEMSGDWMLTHSGRQFYPTAPRVEDVEPSDIARALSMQCRYNGHLKDFYSVAEHCVLMSYAVPEEDALWALLHDATEAYIGDMVRPLKRQIPQFSAIEDRVMAVIAEVFGLEGDMPASVKDADNRILLTERAALLARADIPWGGGLEDLEPLPVEIQAWSPAEAEEAYLQRLFELAPPQRAQGVRPPWCCGKCPPIEGGGYDCTCRGNPRCAGPEAELDEPVPYALTEGYARDYPGQLDEVAAAEGELPSPGDPPFTTVITSAGFFGADPAHRGGEVRITSSTGAQKGTKEARFGLIPVIPQWWLAVLYGRGAAKYAERNWEAGYDWHLSYDAALRHLNAFWNGEDFDPETGVPHPICAVFHMFALVQYMQTHPEFDDRPQPIALPAPKEN